jgi:hypothetical protein
MQPHILKDEQEMLYELIRGIGNIYGKLMITVNRDKPIVAKSAKPEDDEFQSERIKPISNIQHA